MKRKCKESVCSLDYYSMWIILCGWILMLSACNSKDQDHEVECLPFQESEDVYWGMIGTDGTVLFSEEFKNQPTWVINGRFLVKNSDDLWEYYTAESTPKKIGGEYCQAGMFYEDVAPVVEKGKPIQLIDKDGNVKATLDKINGKTVSECKNYCGGLMAVKIDGLWGAVDTSGRLIIEPKYYFMDISKNGNMLVSEEKYRDKDFPDKVFTVLSRNGQGLSSIKMSKYETLLTIYTNYLHRDYVLDDAVIPMVKKEKEQLPGILGLDGEWIMRPSSKVKQVFAIRKDKIIFSDGEKWGLMDITGKELIRPKFNILWFLDNDVLCGEKSKGDGFMLYTLEGEKLGNEAIKSPMLFFDAEHAFAEVSDHDYVLINKKGEELKLSADIYKIGLSYADNSFESDYVDFADLVDNLKMTKVGFLGLTTDLKGDQALLAINNIPGVQNFLGTDAKGYKQNGYVWTKVKTHKLTTVVEANIAGLVNETVSNNGWWSSTEYSWSNKTVPCYNIYFELKDTPQLAGRMRDLYVQLSDKIKSLGNVVKSGENAVVVQVSDGLYYYAYWSGSRIAVFFGYFDAESINENEFDNATEDIEVPILRPTIIDHQ